MKEITISQSEFKDIASDVAVSLMDEAEEHGVNPVIIALLTALFSARLDDALFEDDNMEVENGEV